MRCSRLNGRWICSVLYDMYETKWKILFFFLCFPSIVYFVFKCIVMFLTHRVSLFVLLHVAVIFPKILLESTKFVLQLWIFIYGNSPFSDLDHIERFLPTKFCGTVLFNFSCDDCNTQDNWWQTMVMQNFFIWCGRERVGKQGASWWMWKWW